MSLPQIKTPDPSYVETPTLEAEVVHHPVGPAVDAHNILVKVAGLPNNEYISPLTPVEAGYVNTRV
jgi:hypothetical protein